MFNKYDLYMDAVQSPQADVKFYQKRYWELRNKKNGLVLREDFCGTAAISAEWVKLNPTYKSFGIDLDPEPLAYGKNVVQAELKPQQKERIKLMQKNVLSPAIPVADIIVAVNFSYCLFKQRNLLKKYFVNVYKDLNPQGIFIVDIFGGSQCMDAITDTHKFKKFTYYWDQKNFDPVTNEADFAIHFKYGNKMYRDVFTYEWRLWSIPELIEIMKEAGFKDVKVFWEGTAKDGTSGNGIFKEVKKGEACMSWIAYVIGIK